LWGWVVLLGLALTACSSQSSSNGTEVAEVSSTDVETVEASDTAPATPTEPLKETPDLGIVEAPPGDRTALSEPTPLPENAYAGASAALEALTSYRFVTSFVFTGQEDGQIESGSIELSGEIMDADRKRFTWKDLSKGEEFQLIQLEDQAWVYSDGAWEAVPPMVASAMSQAVLVFAPSVVWGGLFGTLESEASFVGRDSVDGVPALHYTSSYHQWAGYWDGQLVDATGDVWIAEAGYPLRYSFSASGIDEDGHRGSVSWTMQLSDANAPIEITPPL
jgi:hypothetical protein